MKPVLGFTRSRRTKQMSWADVRSRACQAHDRICGVASQHLSIKGNRLPSMTPVPNRKTDSA